MSTYAVPLYCALVLAACISVVLRPEAVSRRSRAPRVRARVFVGAALFLNHLLTLRDPRGGVLT